MQCPDAPRRFTRPFYVVQIGDVVNFHLVRDLGIVKMCRVPYSPNNNFDALSEDERDEVYETVLESYRSNI